MLSPSRSVGPLSLSFHYTSPTTRMLQSAAIGDVQIRARHEPWQPDLGVTPAPGPCAAPAWPLAGYGSSQPDLGSGPKHGATAGGEAGAWSVEHDRVPVPVAAPAALLGQDGSQFLYQQADLHRFRASTAAGKQGRSGSSTMTRIHMLYGWDSQQPGSHR
ncbi:unnamed protein product [Urochloa humidicola]